MNQFRDLRCFVFVNMYLSGIRSGIQVAHAVADLVDNNRSDALLRKWIERDKTIIVKMGGDSTTMTRDWLEPAAEVRAAVYRLKLPMGFFAESGLGNCFTAVAIVAPDWVHGWQPKPSWREDEVDAIDADTRIVAEYIRSKSMAS